MEAHDDHDDSPPLTKATKVKATRVRTEAQQESFRRAVETLKVKRQAEREDKDRQKAAKQLESVEKRVSELKVKTAKPLPPPAAVAVAAASPPAAASPSAPVLDSSHLLSQVERLLDSKLSALLAPVSSNVVVKARKKRTKIIVEGDSSSEDEARLPAQRPRAAPASAERQPQPRHAIAPNNELWYNALFS